MSEEQNTTLTVELAAEPEKAIVNTTIPPTRTELKDKGWSKAELDSAEKRGMIQKQDSEKKAEPKPETDNKPESRESKTVTTTTPPAPEKKFDTAVPDFTFKTPEQEKAFMDAFGPGTPQRAMYIGMKEERRKRQVAQEERDRLALEVQLYRDQKERAEKPQLETDEEGNVIDPEDRPLTMKQLRAMQKAEQEELNKQQKDLYERSSKASEALKNQEEFAKTSIPDFDDTVRLAADLVQNIDQIPEKWKRDKVIRLIKDLQTTAATADKYGLDDYNAPMISYELGQLHPKYGKGVTDSKSDQDGITPKVDPKANGSQLTPEQMKRIEENTQRRASSASLPGSSNGRRVVSIDDITIKDVLKMSPEERFKFKKDHPEKMNKLMRG